MTVEMKWEHAKEVGLTQAEWNHLISTLGRSPTLEELHMVGVQWSEHCSYKSSKHFLKNLMSSGEAVLQGPGENAGLVKFDDRRCLAFKIESHNHPSYVEPFQGAATGVGGILRDIFTMGARPIALANYLRFGDFKTERMPYLLKGVVNGISHYGNCIGIPTLGGEVHCDSSYDTNILVNVFALGVANPDKIFYSNTAKPGQSVMIWGARTGRDGIHGASLLASADFEEGVEDEKKSKIRVQVGDPFQEKILMEACLECMETLRPKLAAIQDMGAAGLTCSTLEISEKSKIGMKLELEKVPMRESNMAAYELLLSESQERMLAIVEKGSEEDFAKILNKWGCESAVLGETTADGFLRISFHGQNVVELPVAKLMDPPAFDLPEPKWDRKAKQTDPEQWPADVKDEWSVLNQLMAHPNIASKQKIYERYDASVGASTVAGPQQAEAAVIWLGPQKEGVAYKGACLESYAAKDPGIGAEFAAAECYRGLSMVGARALALTDGMNMGNPTTPHVQAALQKSVEGLNRAMKVFETPCVSGNVSLYNQRVDDKGARDIKPSMFVVMVGKVDDVSHIKPSYFTQAGNEVWLIESFQSSQSLPLGSLYAELRWSQELQEYLPELNLEAEKKLGEAVKAGLGAQIFESIRDVSDGGVACALAESCFGPEQHLGFEGDWSKSQDRRDKLLFSESGGRAIVEIKPENRAALMKLSMKYQTQIKRLGSLTEKNEFRIRPLMSGSLEELYQSWSGSFDALSS